MMAKYLRRRFLVFLAICSSLACMGQALADAGADDINAELITAAFLGNLEQVQRLLEKGANVNAKRDNGITALMGASLEGHTEIVEVLLAKGADVNAKNNILGSGYTACDYASRKDHQDIVKLLVRAGAFYEEKERIDPFRKEKVATETENHPVSRSNRRD
ncbi:MAG: ankyrin repeat domain-containing protein [Desulforhopalus sp.]|nr:ankyrin repeat domain-containing protein [Desulforhopalus sp.]